ncbi:MAG: putative surface protein with fasciclin (FAS1) repeats [Saprospiraceae bacterium]
MSGDEIIATISGQNVTLTDENGGVTAVTATDITASNGVIDSVVLPK